MWKKKIYFLERSKNFQIPKEKESSLYSALLDNKFNKYNHWPTQSQPPKVVQLFMAIRKPQRTKQWNRLLGKTQTTNNSDWKSAKEPIIQILTVINTGTWCWMPLPKKIYPQLVPAVSSNQNINTNHNNPLLKFNEQHGNFTFVGFYCAVEKMHNLRKTPRRYAMQSEWLEFTGLVHFPCK